MMEGKEKEAGYWGKRSDTYDKSLERIIGKDVRRKLAGVLEDEHGLGDAVEFGCGTGFFTGTLAKNADHVNATDVSPRMQGWQTPGCGAGITSRSGSRTPRPFHFPPARSIPR